MRIAFFGGTFDPPHCGHLAIAEAAIDRLAIDRVLMAPAGQQPFKQDASAPSSFADRLAMVRLAVSDHPQIAVSLLDAPRADHRPNYTFDSLKDLRQTLAPGDTLFCLMGADSFLTLRKWHRASELLPMAAVIVAARPGFALKDAAAALPAGIRPVDEGTQTCAGYLTLNVTNDAGQRSAIYLMPDLQVDISATQIRKALADGTAEQSLLPSTVVPYIKEHNLYRQAAEAAE
jgi:nicotinate-nucleotide adenylyltransferase